LAIALDTHDAQCTLKLDGEIDINVSSELKRTLLEMIASGKTIQLDLAGVSDLDISAIQLLWAAFHDTAKKGVRLRVNGPVPKNLSRTLRDAGFDDFLSSARSDVLPASSTGSGNAR